MCEYNYIAEMYCHSWSAGRTKDRTEWERCRTKNKTRVRKVCSCWSLFHVFIATFLMSRVERSSHFGRDRSRSLLKGVQSSVEGNRGGCQGSCNFWILKNVLQWVVCLQLSYWNGLLSSSASTGKMTSSTIPTYCHFQGQLKCPHLFSWSQT